MLGLLKLKKKVYEYKNKKEQAKIQKQKEELRIKIENMDPNDEFYDIYVMILENYEELNTTSELEKKLSNCPNVIIF